MKGVKEHVEGFIAQSKDVQEELSALDYLDQGKEIYKERNERYGDSYKEVGILLFAMFPNGLTLRSIAEFNRFCLFLHCLDKLRRYSTSMTTGGHPDSAIDLSVYAAMLRELTMDEP